MFAAEATGLSETHAASDSAKRGPRRAVRAVLCAGRVTPAQHRSSVSVASKQLSLLVKQQYAILQISTPPQQSSPALFIAKATDAENANCIHLSQHVSFLLENLCKVY